MIDPLELSEKVERIVSSGEKKKYYRFRPAFYYGGLPLLIVWDVV